MPPDPSPDPTSQRASRYGLAALLVGAGALVANRRTERVGGWAALARFVAVYPANVHDAFTNPPTDARGIASWGRLPLQLPLFAWALHHGRARHGSDGGMVQRTYDAVC